MNIITHFKVDTITYEEPTIPPQLRLKPRTKISITKFICIHRKNTPIGTNKYIQEMFKFANSLQIPELFAHIAPPTPHNTHKNQFKTWAKLMYPPPPTTHTPIVPPYSHDNKWLRPKFSPQLCYYIDGSFKPPKT